MRKYFIGIFILATALTSAAQSPVLPAELKPYVLPGYEMMDLAKADLNGDRLGDYVLILKKAGEDTIGYDNPDWEVARPLLLITRQPGGKLKQVARNDELILCKNCGGVFGDPYQGITTKPGVFAVNFYGGSSWRWSEEYRFKFDKVKKDWFLDEHRSSSFHAADPENTSEESIMRRAETGDITLQNFSSSYNADSSSWKVIAPKTYFYTSPELNSKPKKAYLLKGDKVISLKQFRNFIECNFENGKGDITHGYLLKKDLQLLRAAKPTTL